MTDLLDLIERECGSVAISGHKSPDGDCIGACFALGMALKTIGKKVYVLLDEYPEKYNLIPGKELLYNDEQNLLEVDTLILLDCASIDMPNIHSNLWEKTKLKINIDHHLSNTNFADRNYVFKSSSTSEIVFNIIRDLKIPMDEKMAAAIYSGIIYDTGGFKHPSTEISTHKIAAYLLEFGIDFSEIHASLLYKHTLNEVKLFSKAIERVNIVEDYPISYTMITQKDMEDLNSTSKNSGGIMDFIFNIQGVEVAAFFSERKDLIKVSLRSRGQLNVAEVALAFNGGGHMNAAGCIIKEDMDTAVNSMLIKLKELFD